MKNSITLILFTTLLIAPPLHAQNYLNVLNARYYLQPGVNMQDSGTLGGLQEFRIETTLPYETESGNTFGIKPQYKSVHIKSDDASDEDLKLHTIKVPIFAYIKWNDKWSTYLDVSPKLNSDLKNVEGNHYQVGALNVNYIKKKEDFFWQFGFVYNQDTYGPFFMPLFGIDWKMNEKDYLAILFPAYAIYERRLSEKLYAGFEIELTGETFRLGGSEYDNSYISQLGENKLTFLTEPHLFLDYYITKHVVLFVKPGLRLFQKYEHYTDEAGYGDPNESYKRITDSQYLEGIVENTFYFEVGMAMRFRYDEEK